MLKGRDLLIYLSYKYKGDWERVYKAIKEKEDVKPEDVNELVAQLKCDTLTILDDNYPDFFKHIAHPPFVLFYHGNINLLLNKEHNLGVCGTPTPSDYGVLQTTDIVDTLSKENTFTIVSTLESQGINQIALQTCCDNSKGTCIAFTSEGLEATTRSHKRERLRKALLIKPHLIISEYLDATIVSTKKSKFYTNRLLTACTKGVVLIEAHKDEQELINTVGFALDNNSEVMCIPNTVNTNSLCNLFIKEGATLVESAKDIEQYLKECHDFGSSNGGAPYDH